MQKQIIYSDFITRLFAMTLDLFFLAQLMRPISGLAWEYIFLYSFKTFLLERNINLSQVEDILSVIPFREFMAYDSGGAFFRYVALYLTFNFLLSGIYFVGCWCYFGTTPGKMLLHLKIVTAENYAKPSVGAFIKRFLSYPITAIGFWSMLLSDKKLGLHDKIAGTVVIKA